MVCGKTLKGYTLALTLFCATFAAAAILMGSLSKAQNARLHDAPEAVEQTQNPYSHQRQAIQAGAQLYANHCGSCHGLKAQGTGNVPALASGPTQSAADGEIFWYI